MRDFLRVLRRCAPAAILFVALQALGQQLIVFDDAVQNGFVTSWSWNYIINTHGMPPYVHSGVYSCGAIVTNSGALRFQHPASSIDGSLYDQVSFWINGGATGGQILRLQTVYNGNPMNSGLQIGPLAPNTWVSYSVNLSDLGTYSDSLFDGFWLQDAVGTNWTMFYVDDVKLNAAPPPDLVTIVLDPTRVLRQSDPRWLGINTAAWDGSLASTGTITALKDIGITTLRWPGGSWGDVYHGMNEAFNTGASGSGWPRTNWGAFTTNLIAVATNINAQVFVIANYGSSSPIEAADWLRFCNITNHANFKFWEIGNENYGSWEEDDNTTLPYQPHDPWTYAMRFRDYYLMLKSVDPTVKIGAVGVVGEDNYANYRNHVAISTRTGTPHYGWTAVMLSTLQQLNITPDFLIDHYYPEYQNDSDSALLGAGRNWANDARDLRQQLTDYLGPTSTNVEIIATENNADSGSQGRQSTSVVDGLYLADSMAQIMKTEMNGFIWWDLRNGQDYGGDFSSSLYGWRNYGDLGIMYGDNTMYPTYYSIKLMQNMVQPGDSVLSAPSDYTLLSSYAVHHADGSLSLLVINKTLGTSLDAKINMANFVPNSTATVRSYGIPQDTAAQTLVGSPDIATNSVSGVVTNFFYTFDPYSLTLFTFTPNPPPAPQLTALPSLQQPAGHFVVQLQGQQSSTFVVQASSDLVNWIPVSTNIATAGPLQLTNNVSPGTPRQFWRAVWKP